MSVDEVFLSGWVSAATAVSSMTVNGQSVAREGREFPWDLILPIRAGGNRFALECRDAYGSTASLVVDVTVDTALHDDIEYSPRLVVLPVPIGTGDSLWGEVFVASFQGNLVRTDRFDVVGREALNKVLEEYSLQSAELTSTEAMLRVGRLLVADSVLLIRTDKRNDYFTVECKIIDVGTGRVHWAADYGLKCLDFHSIDRVARGISLDLERIFSRCSAVVVDVSGWPESYLDVGRDKGIRAGLKVIGSRDGQRIEGKVVQVQEGVSNVVFDATGSKLSPGDSVVLLGIFGATVDP
jgi:hypothetical protein